MLVTLFFTQGQSLYIAPNKSDTEKESQTGKSHNAAEANTSFT